MATYIPPNAPYNKWEMSPKKKMFIGMVIGIILGMMSFFALTQQVEASNTQVVTGQIQTFEEPQPSIKDKMVNYMRHVNPRLDTDVAYRLADGILEQKKRFNLPVSLQLGLIKTESTFDQYAISKAGAVGFYQILPKWHIDRLNKLFDKGVIETKNLYAAKTQSAMGGEILYECLNKHRNRMDMALQCYNGNTPDESKRYAKKVLQASNEAAEFI